jgi:hypothetical protein
MNKLFTTLLSTALACAALPAMAHHSFAVWDMTQNVEFKGVVENVKFRNPHAAMTLTVKKPDGSTQTVEFTETAPANMLVRMGLTPDILAVGKKITAIGAPRKDDPSVYFLKAVIAEDGQKFQIMPP